MIAVSSRLAVRSVHLIFQLSKNRRLVEASKSVLEVAYLQTVILAMDGEDFRPKRIIDSTSLQVWNFENKEQGVDYP